MKQLVLLYMKLITADESFTIQAPGDQYYKTFLYCNFAIVHLAG
jgi:hypothetical protein